MLYFYYSPVSGKNIVRRFTSLTGERVKKDPAFKGFRESGNRMKEASPIAAALYKMVPAEVKQYSLYRLLTGEAMKMLKQGLDKATITKTLKEKHIVPLLDPQVGEYIRRERIRPGNSDNKPNRLGHILRYFPIDTSSARKSRIRRHRQRERLVKNLSASVGNLQQNPMPVAEQPILSSGRANPNTDRLQRVGQEQILKPKTKYPELIYRCRLRECKKLKLYIRSSFFPGVAY